MAFQGWKSILTICYLMKGEFRMLTEEGLVTKLWVWTSAVLNDNHACTMDVQVKRPKWVAKNNCVRWRFKFHRCIFKQFFRKVKMKLRINTFFHSQMVGKTERVNEIKTNTWGTWWVQTNKVGRTMWVKHNYLLCSHALGDQRSFFMVAFMEWMHSNLLT